MQVWEGYGEVPKWAYKEHKVHFCPDWEGILIGKYTSAKAISSNTSVELDCSAALPVQKRRTAAKTDTTSTRANTSSFFFGILLPAFLMQMEKVRFF